MRTLRATLCAVVFSCLSACAHRYYSISFINVGRADVSVQELRWGEREFPGDSIAPDIVLVAADRPAPMFNVAGGWRIPEQVSLTWTPKGMPLRTRWFDIRKFVRNPNSFESTFTFEFEGSNVRVYLTPGRLNDPLEKTLIVEILDQGQRS
ncbi:MAG TPA: hypothetical protein VGO61_20695 [Steroidobacteraceae bacterium]|jgi:hypothetical protein|nr:hypothetical protein [Steroidobacteraceae bacterium]